MLQKGAKTPLFGLTVVQIRYHQQHHSLTIVTEDVYETACRLFDDSLSTAAYMSSFIGYGKMGLGGADKKRTKKSLGGKSVWCCTEKVHGANFSVHVDRTGLLRYAKRTGWLSTDETFFNYHSCISRLRSSLQHAAQVLLEENPHVLRVAFFGELCGGHYPHEKVQSAGDKAVQVGVWYAPRIEFLIFDMALIHATAAESVFIPYARAVELAEAHDLPHVPLLCIGARGICADYDPRFQSKVPESLGLPPIEGNMAEGFVAKPYNIETPMVERPIFKLKTKEFSECAGSPPARGDPTMVEYILGLVNENRVAAAASKVGDPRDRDHWDEIVDLVLQDVVEEVGTEDETLQRMVDQIRCLSYDTVAQLNAKQR